MRRTWITALASVALLALATGGYIGGEVAVTESDVAPALVSQVWVKNKSAAVYDADSSVWLSVAEDAYYFGRNSTTAANEWLRFGPNGSASDPGNPSLTTSAQGYYLAVPSVITRVDLSLNGDWTAKAACTLMVCLSTAGAAIDTAAYVAFSAPDNLGGSHVSTWIEADSASVISAKLLTGAGTVNNPNFTLRVREKRTP